MQTIGQSFSPHQKRDPNKIIFAHVEKELTELKKLIDASDSIMVWLCTQDSGEAAEAHLFVSLQKSEYEKLLIKAFEKYENLISKRPIATDDFMILKHKAAKK